MNLNFKLLPADGPVSLLQLGLWLVLWAAAEWYTSFQHRCRLNAVVAEVATERAQRFQGRTMEVLVEGPNPKDATQACGRIQHNKLVYFDGDGAALKGKLVNVELNRCNAYSLYGDMVGMAPSVAEQVTAAAAQQQQVLVS